MKRFLVSVAALVVLAWPFGIGALTLDSGRTTMVGQDAVVEGMYLVGGGTVDLAGTFKNDVYVGGGTVTIRGPVEGDVLVAGGTVKISSEVKGSVRVVGGTLDLDAKVGRNLVMVGGTLTAGSQADVQGHAILLGGTVSYSGHLVGDLDIWAGSVTLDGKIDGSVMVNLGPEDPDVDQRLILGPGTAIAGDLTYYADAEAEIRDGAVVQGKTEKLAPTNLPAIGKDFFVKMFAFARLWNLFSVLVVAALFVLMAPKTLRIASDLMLRRKGATLGWGLLVFLAAPITFVVLPFTLIGVPLMLILAAAFMIGMYVSQIALGFTVGAWLLRLIQGTRSWTMSARVRTLIATFLGIVAVSVVFDFLLIAGVVPRVIAVLAGLARFGLTLWSFGGLILSKAAYLKDYEQA